MGASLAFDAGLERFRREDYILLNYHLHIPAPDPMTNPSTLARQAFYAVRGTPSFYIDGDTDGGGGSADQARSIFDRKVDPVIQKHLEAPPDAKIDLRVTRTGGIVKAKANVSKVTSKSDKLKLHIVLVEDMVRYSGENGMRFHEMVVRGMAEFPAAAAAKPAADAAAAKDAKPSISQGFAIRAGKGGSFEYTFDLAKLVEAGKAHLEDFETNTRKGQYKFRERKHEITTPVAVVAFVQDEATKKILQAIYVKPAGTTTN